jgi:hypothetical protein
MFERSISITVVILFLDFDSVKPEIVPPCSHMVAKPPLHRAAMAFRTLTRVRRQQLYGYEVISKAQAGGQGSSLTGD